MVRHLIGATMNKIRLEIYTGSFPRLAVASRRNGGYRVCGDKLYGYVTPNVTFEVDAEMLIELIKQYMFDENDWSEDE